MNNDDTAIDQNGNQKRTVIIVRGKNIFIDL